MKQSLIHLAHELGLDGKVRFFDPLSVREIARDFGQRLGKTPIFSGEESTTALLSNAADSHKLFGLPTVTANQMMDWVANWITGGGRLLNKPTHFEARDGKY